MLLEVSYGSTFRGGVLLAVLAFLLAGLVGLSLGLLGAGGSILAVPILRYAAGLPAKQAVATSLATVGSVAMVGALIAWKERRLRLRAALQFSLLASMGTLLGVKVATLLHDKVQMALFLIVMVVALFAMKSQRPAQADHGRARLVWQAIGVGVLTGLVGVGGGFLIVPALVAIYRLPMREATGTSLAVIAINSYLGMLSYSQAMSLDWVFTLEFVGSALAGLLGGLSLGRRVQSQTTERVFFAALTAVAIYTLVSEFGA